MKEKQIEQKFVRLIGMEGGLALKLISPGFDGMPDRMVLLPGGRIAFVEVKAPGKALRALQGKRKRQLEALGFLVYVLDDERKVYATVNGILEGKRIDACGKVLRVQTGKRKEEDGNEQHT